MPSVAFISYRRSDSQQAALGLYFQLRARLGPNRVFMDVSGISVGQVWSQRLRRALEQATVVLALIGPDWLRAADEYGRRRLDKADDWVRNELLLAAESGRAVLPLLVGSMAGLPPAEALPAELQFLLDHQAYALREDRWEADVNGLVEILVREHQFKETERRVPLPQPEVTVAPLSEAELDRELMSLPGWEPVDSLIPGDYPRSRQELRKAFSFRSFRAAVQFMSASVDAINKVQHHPRWENQWRTVTVHLSTWDIGYRISRIDVDVARMLDAVYEEVAKAATAKAVHS